VARSRELAFSCAFLHRPATGRRHHRLEEGVSVVPVRLMTGRSCPEKQVLGLSLPVLPCQSGSAATVKGCGLAASDCRLLPGAHGAVSAR
jgi:hypothetical protein